MLSKLNRRARWLTFVSLIMLQAFLSLGSVHISATFKHMLSTNSKHSILNSIAVQRADTNIKSPIDVAAETAPMMHDEITENGQLSVKKEIAPSSVQASDKDVDLLTELLGRESDVEIAEETIASEQRTIEVIIASYEQQGQSSVVTDEAEQFDERAILERYEPVAVTATGYYAGPQSTGKDLGHPEYGITYSGVKVVRDSNALSTIAADIDIFPLGTILYIPGYGYGIVADIGSAVKGKTIDLYFETIEDVYSQWGKKDLDVYLIEKGDGKLTSEMFSHFQTIYTKI